MLSNAYFLAKFRFDTAENEPAKNLQNFANFPNFAIPNPLLLSSRMDARLLLRRALQHAAAARSVAALSADLYVFSNI